MKKSKMNEISEIEKSYKLFSCYNKNPNQNFQKQFILSFPSFPFTHNNMFPQVRKFFIPFKTSIIVIEMEVIMTCQSSKFYVF